MCNYYLKKMSILIDSSSYFQCSTVLFTLCLLWGLYCHQMKLILMLFGFNELMLIILTFLYKLIVYLMFLLCKLPGCCCNSLLFLCLLISIGIWSLFHSYAKYSLFLFGYLNPLYNYRYLFILPLFFIIFFLFFLLLVINLIVHIFQ